ncbi:hypothetical protein WMY93_018111 [Mugilogobius chulae]|uniref:Uncharacterized protein n=1 Tax=Mugilogobius chulae TaxID=88201 RepID=A0AAW0NTV5_9GOBI
MTHKALLCRIPLPELPAEDTECPRPAKRKRSFLGQPTEITPYMKQPKASKFFFQHFEANVAKPAWRIQDTESPKFDKLFIELGPFHLRCAYFAAVGYFLTGSGYNEALCMSHILGSGSLAGKQFNRAIRIHPILLCALSELHIQRFLEDNCQGKVPSTVQRMLDVINQEPEKTISYISMTKPLTALTSFLLDYENYCRSTMAGIHGQTAQFAMIYMEMIKNNLLLDRALRTCDPDLYTYAMGQSLAVFWAANRPNYKRWAIKAFLQLVNRDNTHPGISEMLKNGGLSVRRTKKNFCRTAHDITLEQTANRDAASPQTGISAFTTNASGRKRWSVTTAARSQVVSILKESVGMQSRDDIAQECKAGRIKTDREAVMAVKETILNMMNPFFTELDPNHNYCITTGRALDPGIAKQLLHWLPMGKEWMDSFISECKTRPARFEERIKSKKVDG